MTTDEAQRLAFRRGFDELSPKATAEILQQRDGKIPDAQEVEAEINRVGVPPITELSGRG